MGPGQKRRIAAQKPKRKPKAKPKSSKSSGK